MTKYIATALIAFAGLTTAASAMIEPAGFERQIQSYAPNADLSTLTDLEIAQLVSIVHSGDSEGEKRNAVRAFLQ